MIIELKGNPPFWGSEAQWYFINEDGEQWIAKRVDGCFLRIAGSDLDWEDIVLNVEQAKAEKERLCYGGVSENKDLHPLAEWIFTLSEKYWLLAVITAAIEEMEFVLRRNESVG